MSRITNVSRVLVPVGDQDEAIAFYTEKLGFELVADTPFGEGDRWVEVAPPGGGTALALVPGRDDYQPGRRTGIALTAADARATHAEFQASGVEIDGELMGGEGQVPLMFFFFDHAGNSLMVVESA